MDLTTILDRTSFAAAGAIFALALRHLLRYLRNRYWPL